VYLDTRLVRRDCRTLDSHVVALGGLRRLQCHLRSEQERDVGQVSFSS